MRGGDTTGLRAYNERLVVSAVQRLGAPSKAEIGRETGLSAQAAAVIVDRLVSDGYLRKLDKVRGQVGQPSTPIALDPGGAFSLGVKIGRRSVEAVLLNMEGRVAASERRAYDAPLPEEARGVALEQVHALLDGLTATERSRLIGAGVAIPGDLHLWSEELGLAPGALDGWRDADVAAEIHEATGVRAELYNDATAACAAEMIVGEGVMGRSALYVYIGSFIGGGVVLDGRLYRGALNNAAAIGSIPAGVADGSGPPPQLIHRCSAIQLERALEGAGLDAAKALSGETCAAAQAVFDRWKGGALPYLAQAVVSAISVIDFETVVLDGLLPPVWRRALCGDLAAAICGFNRAGLVTPQVVEGSVGPIARVLGAGLMPLAMRFSPTPELLR